MRRAPPWLLLAILPLAGCVDDSEPVPDRVDVRLVDSEFVPANLTVNATKTVRWTNEGQQDHTVMIQGPNGTVLLDVEDPGLRPGNHVEYAFSGPGAYTVVCRYHVEAGMRMTVEVVG